MQQAIHISKARQLLDSGAPVDLTVVKSDGSLLQLRQCVSLRDNQRQGTRTVKLLSSGRIIAIRDALIIHIDDFQVFI